MADLEERREELQPGINGWEDKLAILFAEMVQMCLWCVRYIYQWILACSTAFRDLGYLPQFLVCVVVDGYLNLLCFLQGKCH